MAILAASVALGTTITVILVITSFGIGIVTFTAVTAAIDAFEVAVTSGVGGLPTDLLQLITLFGFGEAIGIILGAIATRVSIVFVSKLAVGLSAGA